ncbi:MAG: PAS domain S-box protein [Bacteroidales bacterium]|nr:PAS domain S-box protein [Bacteroidales bacterium]
MKKQDTENLYLNFFNHSVDLLCITDNEGTLIKVNPQWPKTLGYNLAELEGKKITEFIHPEDKDKTLAIFNNTKIGNISHIYINRYKSKDGLYKVLEWESCRYGKLWYSTAHDVTERIYVEQKLKESEDKYRSIVENSLAAIFTIDENFRFIYGNDELCNVSGYSKKELAGMDFRKLISPASLEIVTDRYIRRQKGEKIPQRYEIEIICKNGQKRIAEMLVSVIKDSGGKPRSMGQLIDITESKKSEIALKESESRLRSFIDESSEGIVIINEEGVIEEWNKSAEKTIGIGRNQAINKKWWDLYYFMHPSAKLKNGSKSILEKKVKESIKTGILQVPASGEFQIIHKSGKIRHISQTLFIIKSVKGNRIAGIITDITDRKNAEDELKRSRLLTDALFESIPGLVYIYNQKGKLIKWNQRHITETGYSAKELQNKNIWDWFIPGGADTKIIKTARKRILKEGLSSSEAYLTKKNGEKALYLFNTALTKIAGERYYAGVGLDITESKKAHEELEYTKTILSAAFMQTPIPMVLVNAEVNRIMLTNDAAAEFLGIKDEPKKIGKSLSEIKPSWRDFDENGNEIPLLEMPLAKALKGIETKGKEFYIKRKDGSIRWESVSSSAVRNSRGEIIAGYLVFPDITEKKEAEQKFKQLVDLQQTILDTTNFGILYLKNRKIQWGNRAFYNMYGYEHDEIYNKEVSVLYAEPPDYKKVGNLGYTLLAKGDVFTDEMKALRKDGDRFWATIHGKAIDPLNINEGTIWVIMDTTEQRLATEKLRESEELYRKLAETSPYGIFLTDLKGNVIFCNRQMAELIGYESADSMLNVNALDVIDPDDHLCVITEAKKLLSNQNSGPEYFTYLRKNNTRFTGEYYGTLIHDSKGMPYAMMGMVNDVTEKKKAEEALLKSEEYLALAQQTAKIGNLELNIETETGYFSDQFYKLFGFNKEEGPPKLNQFLKALHPDDRHIIIETVASENRYDHSWTVNYRSNPEHGPIRYFHSITRMLCNPVDKSNTLFATIQDITEQKKAEEEIIKLNLELEKKVEERTRKLNELNKDLEAFAYSVSHDLRAPVRHIDGFVKMMFSRLNKPDDTITNYFSKITSATERMSDMIDSLLSFSRLGRTVLKFTDIDLEQMIKEIIELFKPDIGKRIIIWKISSLPIIKGDKNLIKLVFENLISNAIKYTTGKNEAIVEIAAGTETESHYEFFVKDNGTGFDMNYSGKLFGVFQRLHDAEEYDGIGIGLANVKQIVAKHGGTVRAEGKINEGAVFYVTLPK